MARLKSKTLKTPPAARQIAFHQLLVGARKTWLRDALVEAVGQLDLKSVDLELHRLTPRKALKSLALAGIRGEYAFPTPLVLATAPKLLGYYRLLLGLSQKAFYGALGFGPFKSMEIRGTLSEGQRRRLPDVCRAMAEALGDLVTQIAPKIERRDLEELPLLTLGAQFQGASNVEIGKAATRAVFLAIREHVEPYMTEETATRIALLNASGRRVDITLGHDPDVRIDEEGERTTNRKVAIEIKGGTDRSNAHNRVGEAEKSHQKARAQGYRDFWTLITLKGLSLLKLKQESPTTRQFFDAAEILARQGKDWDAFRDKLASEAGIKLRA